jgi:hypothetical protein
LIRLCNTTTNPGENITGIWKLFAWLDYLMYCSLVQSQFQPCWFDYWVLGWCFWVETYCSAMCVWYHSCNCITRQDKTMTYHYWHCHFFPKTHYQNMYLQLRNSNRKLEKITQWWISLYVFFISKC